MVLHHPHHITNNRPSFRLFDGDTFGVDNLSADLTSNGTTVTPTFRYKGGDANAVNWAAWNYGETIDLQAGTAPSYNQGSPLLGSNDDSVKFNNGGYYKADNNTFADVTTEDIVIEMVIKTLPVLGNSEYILNKKSTAGYVLYSLYNKTQFCFALFDGIINIGINTGTLDLDTWYHIVGFINRDENSTNGSQWYVNGIASGSGSNFSTIGSNTVAQPLIIGGHNTSKDYYSNIAYAAMWLQSNWHAAGASGPAEWATIAAERFARLTGTYPQKANGTAMPTTATRASVAYLDKIESGNRVMYSVGDNWMRQVQRPDAAWNETLVGYLSEKPQENLLLNSQDFTQWIALDDGDNYSANSCTTPNKATDGYGIIADATDGVHGLQQTVTLANGTHYFSVWAKKGDQDYLILGDPTLGGVRFNLNLGTVDYEDQATGYIEDWGNMYRCCAVCDVTAGSHTLQIRASDADGYFAGDGVSVNTHIYGAQLEYGYYMSSYIKTGEATASRSADQLVFSLIDGNLGGRNDQRGTVTYNFLTNDYNNAVEKWFGLIRDSAEGLSESMGMYLDADGKVKIWIDTGGTSGTVDGTSVVTDGYVHNLRATYNTIAFRLYVDGTQEDADIPPPGVPDNLDQVMIGEKDNEYELNGIIGNLIFYPFPTLKDGS